jgi:hypothetical protein
MRPKINHPKKKTNINNDSVSLLDKNLTKSSASNLSISTSTAAGASSSVSFQNLKKK